MQRILSNQLWHEIKSVAAKAKKRRAAIAYVTQDLLGLRDGDVLVCDASKAAVKAGETDAKFLKNLFRDGVELHCCPSLHAKVMVLDDIAVIGSGNMSKASRSSLVEAAFMTDSPSAVGGVESLLEQLISQSKRLTEGELASLAKIKVVRRGGRNLGAKGEKPKISKLGTRTWLAGIYELEKTTTKEEAYVNKVRTALAEEHGGTEDDIEWVKWSGRGKFALECRPGDRVISIWRERAKDKLPEGVYEPATVLKRKRRDGVTYLFFRPSEKATKMGWGPFKQEMKKLRQRPPTKNTNRILDPDVAEALSSRWKRKINGKRKGGVAVGL